MTETLRAPHSDGSAAAPPQPAASHPDHARRWWILAVIGVAQLMVVLDSTVVNIALPSAQADLGFSDASRQWVVTAYALAFGSLLLIGGRVADVFGRKRVFLIGLAGFAVASAIGGAAVDFPMLVAARAVQGAFGALLAPAGLSLLTTTFTEAKERGKAFGIYGGIAGAGASIGLLLGGFLTEYASWRWTMFVNLVFAAFALAGGMIFLTHRAAESRPHLDLIGTVLVSAGLFSLVYGFSNADTNGWTNPWTVGFLVAAAVLLVAFVAFESTASNPLLPMRVVLDRNRGGAYLAMFFAAIGMFGIFLFLTYYLEVTLGYSSVKTGLVFLPMTALLVVTAGSASTLLATRVSPRVLIPGGMILAAIGMTMLTRIGLQSHYASVILPGTLVIGLGLGLIFAPAFSIGTLGVRPEDSGVASATVNTVQQVGGSIGTALLNTIASTAAATYVAAHLHDGSTQLVQARAALHSYTTAFWWSAAIFAVAGVLVAITLRSGVPQLDDDAPSPWHIDTGMDAGPARRTGELTMTATKPVPAEEVSSRPLRKDAARNRELLVAAAREVFASRGLDATLDDVARHANVGVGTAYRHFANKYELAGAILDQVLDEVVADAQSCLECDDPWTGLVRFLEGVLVRQSADRGLREVLTGAKDSARMAEVQARMAVPVGALIERAHAAGAIGADVTITDLGIVVTMLCTVADLGAQSRPDLWRRYLPCLLAGLRPGGPQRAVAPLTQAEFEAASAALHHHAHAVALGRQGR